MDSDTFDEIKNSLQLMDYKQLSTLLDSVAEAKGANIYCAAYRKNFDKTLEENGKSPLTDDEWEKNLEILNNDRNLDNLIFAFVEITEKLMEEVRPSWNCEDDDFDEETDGDAEDEYFKEDDVDDNNDEN